MSGIGQRLYQRARKLIPGGTQLLSKRPEMFLPEYWPAYYSKARGVDVWDLDGTRYVDMSYNGIGACVLGAADPDVNAAVHTVTDIGNMSTLNAPEEVELAELLCELHPWAEMVRYTRGGGEAMAVAVRIARANTRRDRIAFCGYHGWHDWYLAANLAEHDALDGHLLPGLEPLGVPRALVNSALPFRYNHPEELRSIVAKTGGDLAAIVMEPIRDHNPEPGFLEEVRETATRIGSVLIMDEVSAGLRLITGGAHLVFGIDPDIAVFAKALGNGYPIAAVIGKSHVMDAAQKTFISSTNWTDRIGPAAALATLRKHRKCDVASHLVRIGEAVQRVWVQAAASAGLLIHVGGIAPLSHFAFEHEHAQVTHTLFTQLMLDRGFLATKGFYATYAHTDAHVAAYAAATEEAFLAIAEALRHERIESDLLGPAAHSGFSRLT